MDDGTLPMTGRVACPCCGYPTLGERAAYEIRELCNWEDDGQGEDTRDEVRGGPNGSHSLAEARENFRTHGVRYAPGRDTRLWPDSELERVTKRMLVADFERLARADSTERSALLAEVHRLEAVLDAELRRKLAEHEREAPDVSAG